MGKGEAQRLASLLGRHPAWLEAGYRTLAEYNAQRGDVVDALELMERYFPVPSIPKAPEMSEAEAARRFKDNSGDVAAGMALYAQAMAAGREAEALTTLQGMSESPGCPVYVHYLEGELLAKHGKTVEAWKALEQCPN